jgi:D-glycero-alpha-D-manno-heptose 1-phosphate guanylyltransferase
VTANPSNGGSHQPDTGVVLVGGFGTRVRHLFPELPKPLAPVAGRPWLEWLLRYLRAQAIRQVILATGYRSEQISEFAARLRLPGLAVTCLRESEPLGTGGALVQAALATTAERFIACNGDSLLLAPLAALCRAAAVPSASGAVYAVEVTDTSEFGSIERSSDGYLTRFAEKRAGAGMVNAGIYDLRRDLLLGHAGRIPLSLERELLPESIARGRLFAVVGSEAPFIDIGSETALRHAPAFIDANRGWFA